MIGIHPTPFSAELVPLSRCSGALYDEGNMVPCSSGCLAHFDANTDGPDYFEAMGSYYNPYPNSLLSAVPHLPGTTDVSGICSLIASCEDAVRVYRNEGFFHDVRNGEAATVYVVVRIGTDPDRHWAAAVRTLVEVDELLREMYGLD